MMHFRTTPMLLVGLFALTQLAHASRELKVVGISTLGADPQTKNRLNGEAFQQDALTTFNGYQYAAFWTPLATNTSVRHAALSRRALKSSAAWETLVLSDYNQTEDDGHDIISIGISRGDGTLHLGFDQHDNPLRFRSSRTGVATNPSSVKWTSELFGPTLDHLSGPAATLSKDPHFINVTYPRFIPVPKGSPNKADLLFELRVGRSGLGDDWLYEYTPNVGWSLIGKYLEGANNNAYINGLDFAPDGNLHATWTYRDYINDTGKNFAVQAGPNGPENNHDLNYAYSADLGKTWQNNWGQKIANLDAEESILPSSAGIVVFGIPKYGGILNQEAQAVDAEGRVHVLNRENTTGVEQWYHYWRSTTIAWTRTPLPLDVHSIVRTPTVIGKRGKLATYNSPDTGITLFAILPSNASNSTALAILASTAAGHFRDWSVVWEADSGCGWEPQLDRRRLGSEGDDVLSLLLVNGTDVAVLDLSLRG